MNLYGLVVLAALVVDFVLEFAANLLNLRALHGELPPGFESIYDRERYRRAQEYTRARTRLAMLRSGVDLTALLVFWFAGGFGGLDRLVRISGLGPIGRGLLFIGVLGMGQAVLAIPFRWWGTFVLESRFGFNRTTPWTFWTDAAKGLLLAAALGAPLVGAVLWLFESSGSSAWLWCWLASALYLVMVQFVAPTWIMPLFNRFAPLGQGALRDAIIAYARSVGFPLAGVFVIDGSRRSTKANAFFTGFGARKRVALFDTLLHKLAPDEIVAVVAHEVGHYKCGHIIQGMAIGILRMGATFFLVSVLLGRPELYEAFGVGIPSVYAGLVFATLVLTPLEVVSSVLMQAWSRRNELEADAFAVTTTGTGARLASALRGLAADSLANLTPHPLYVALHYSHPPLPVRIRALEDQAPAARWQPAT
jgi:STE24 endopeptidase